MPTVSQAVVSPRPTPRSENAFIAPYAISIAKRRPSLRLLSLPGLRPRLPPLILSSPPTRSPGFLEGPLLLAGIMERGLRPPRGGAARLPLALPLLLLCSGAAAAAAPQGPAGAGVPAPLLCNVSLDSPPEERWLPVLRRHFDPALLREAFVQLIDKVVPKWVHAIIRPLAEEIESFVPQPFAGEIRGLCQALGLSVGDGLLLNLAYEITTYCTSIIAQDTNGSIYHGRNLDAPFLDIFQKTTINVDFLKNGQVKFRGTTFFGYVGLWTGQSPSKFTFSGDARDRSTWWETAVAAFLNRNSPASWLARTVLSEAEDFEAAALMLSKTPIIANVYFIIGGTKPGEGAVITRRRSGPVDIWPLDPLTGGWYRVETNYDHWTTPPPLDHRRTQATKALNATGQKNINLESLYKVLSVYPVLNEGTVYTTVMSAATPGKYMTRIRNLV